MSEVSVIIATRYRPNLLPRAVESAKKAGKDVEVIVVDDASTDETSEVCKGLTGIKYIRVDRNQGLGGARNIGMLASAGEYISFLDDDDVRLPGSLDAQIELLEANKDVGLVYGQAFLANQQGEVIKDLVATEEYFEGDVFWALMYGNFICCLTAVFRRSCLLRVGMLDGSLPGNEDWDLWIRIAELYPVVALREPVGIWRRATPDSRQFTSDMAKLLLPAIEAHKYKWCKLPRVVNAPDDHVRKMKIGFMNRVSEAILSETYVSIVRGKYMAAIEKVARLVRTNPRCLTNPYIARVVASALLVNLGLKKPKYELPI